MIALLPSFESCASVWRFEACHRVVDYLLSRMSVYITRLRPVTYDEEDFLSTGPHVIPQLSQSQTPLYRLHHLRSIPMVLVCVDDQPLHKPHRFHQSIRLDMFVNRMNSSCILADQIPKSVDVPSQVPVSFGIRVSVTSARQCRRSFRRTGYGLPDSEARNHDEIRMVGALARAPRTLR